MSIEFERLARFFLVCLSGLGMILMKKAVYHGFQRTLVRGWEGKIPMSEKGDACVGGLAAKMDQWNAEIDLLSAKVDQAKAEAKIE